VGGGVAGCWLVTIGGCWQGDRVDSERGSAASAGGRRDFFVSHASRTRPWAEWLVLVDRVGPTAWLLVTHAVGLACDNDQPVRQAR
jgi:hypothetical protein